MSFQNRYNFDEIVDKTVYFSGNDYDKIKIVVKDYIGYLSKNNNKIFLLDSFWSKDYYDRFKRSRFLKEIERKYHIKISVEEFLNKDNIIEYMNSKNVNIAKVKSIEGYMSAAELFPVIVSKVNETIKDSKAYILINDFVLDEVKEETFIKLIENIDTNHVKFIVINKDNDVGFVSNIIDSEISVD